MHGRVHHFGAIGIINGLAVLADRESGTHWDHITGEAFAGPLAGYRLDAWPVRMTTVRAARWEYPDLIVHASENHGLLACIAQRLYPRFIYSPVWLPPPFYASMSRQIDPRLPRLTQGFGVIAGGKARYYPISVIPMEGLEDAWGARILHIARGALDGVPQARWKDTGEFPMQLLSRWYGFSFTYPYCEIYEPEISH